MKILYSLPSVFLLLVVLLLPSCGPDKDRARFEGKLSNITNAEFYAYSECGAFEGIDTIRIEDGEFVYERQLTQPTLITLLYPNFTQTYFVAEPGRTVKMKGDAARIGEAELSGTNQNDLLSDFFLNNLKAPESNQRLAAADFIRKHTNTLAAVAVFQRYFSAKYAPDTQLALSLLDVLKKAQPKQPEVRYLDEFYRPIFNNGVGRQLPAFETTALNGKRVSSADYKGRPLLICTLASWQSESYTFIRQVHAKVKQANPRPEVLIVSMDVEKDALNGAMKNDSIPYPIVCDRKAFESPLVQKLGLHYVPACMLVNEKGVIVQRDVTTANDLKLDKLR